MLCECTNISSCFAQYETSAAHIRPGQGFWAQGPHSLILMTGGPKDFFGSDILAKRDFFGSMKDPGIFLGRENNTGIFLGIVFFISSNQQ